MSKTKHNYKTLADVIRAMLDGVVFYCASGAAVRVIRYDESRLLEHKSAIKSIPFTIGDDAIQYAWSCWPSWTVESHWYENIPSEGVLCWVWDEEVTEVHDQAALITSYRIGNKAYPYHDNMSMWGNATPVKPSECLTNDGE